jgi:ATP-binding cassette subfamily B protein
MGKYAVLYFGAILGSSIFGGLFSVIASFLVKNLFTMAQRGTTDGLLKLIVENLLSGSIVLAVSITSLVVYNNEAKRAAAKLNQLVYMKAVRLPIDYYETHHTGDFMSKLIYDAARSVDVFGSRLRRVISPIINVVVYIIPMLYLCPQVTIGLIAVNSVALAVNALMIKPMKKVSSEMSRVNKTMAENLTNILQGIETIKVFAAKDIILDEYDTSNEQCAKAQNKGNMYSAVLTGLNNAFNLLCSLVFLGIGIYYLEKGKVDVGSLTALYTLYGAFSWNFLQIGRYIPELVNCLINAQRVFEFLDMEEEPETYIIESDQNIYENTEHERAYVSMEHITFKYPKSDKNVLEDFNLSVDKGTSVAITGHSGRGKSTMAKLLLGFYPAEKGQIYIDGVALEKLGLHKLRELIAYVPQEPYLYNVSIAENISYGRPEAAMEEIMKAAKAANAHDFIVKQSNGYDTLVGERGAKLSGGEKQRIAIARAILKNAPILLLDEATSALDNESEHLVQQAIQSLMKDRTTIMIAHRPSTIATADVEIQI